MDTKTYSSSEIQTMYENMCRELNMDKQTEEAALASFLDASQKFTLSGDPHQWLCCAVVVACTESFTPTVGGSNEMVKNGVSLTKILRVFRISLYHFFDKAKIWCEMAHVSKNFLNTLDRLEQSCKITLNLKDSYCKIFMKLFIVPPHVQKNKKSRPGKCSAQKLYELMWCLFLCAKNQGIPCTVDLVSSFHLLLCCIDLIYKNALVENRVDLINPAYEGLPKNWNTPDFDPSTLQKHCIIEQLCKTEGGLEEQAKQLKSDSFKKIITEFMETKTLFGDKQTFMGIISNNNFETNLKSLNNAYERYILSVGEFDERILPPYINSRKNNSDGSGVNSSYLSQNERSLGPCTPLLRRDDLPAKNNISEPVASATQNVKILQEIAARQECIDFLKQAGDSTYEKLQSKHDAMEAIFLEKFPAPKSEAKARYELARLLHYYLLEKIVRAENLPPKIAIETDTINTVLVVCCVQLVLFSYESDLKFPWVLKCFNLKAFNFVKIIEVVVKRQDKLSREMIKHLNFIEERCLEYLVWKSDSPMWEHVQKRNAPLPTSQEVEVNNMARNVHSTNSSYDGFNSTSTATTSDSARRDLFNAGRANESRQNNSSNSNQQAAKPLKIVLRKIYELSWMRMKELCKELNMAHENYLKKIWTLFEYSITQRTELMKDRHLDQLIMCAIYIYIKVGEIQGKTFTDIMKMYRKQPQATSQIYREILIDPSKPDGERTGDIINFYNNIYVQKMTPYALSFGDKNKSQHDLLLSPHPNDRVNPSKKVSNCLTICHLEKSDIQYSPNSVIYKCYQSPAKDLSNMNEIISRDICNDQNYILGKRKAENTIESSEITHPSKRNLNFNKKDSSVIANPKSNHFNSQLLSIKKDRQAGQKE